MSKKLLKYTGIIRRMYKLETVGGEYDMSKRRMGTKSNNFKCAQTPVPKEKSLTSMVSRDNLLDLPVICVGGKSMREMYLDEK